jgi:SAM-dependent methyltransferase/uncharacterized protein YbaR (Trm112 family)
MLDRLPRMSRRNFAVEIAEGLLVCGDCGRWYPIAGQLPEILPDHLRDAARDNAILRSLAAAMPDEVRGALAPLSARADAADGGAHYKAAEMAIASKVNDPEFFGPGYSVPFNPWNPEFSLFMVAVFGAVISVMKPRQTDTVLDSGCGYAWTTEWLHRSGLRAIGVDITRVYLEIAVARMGPSRPHLIVADAENLPVQAESADAVLAYESFHHIPDRRRAMAGYDSRAPSRRARRVRRARRAARDQRRGGRRDDEVRDPRARHGAGRRDRLHGGDAPDARRAGLRLAALRSAGGPRGLGRLSEEAPPLRRQHLSHQPRRPRRAIRGRAIAPRTAQGGRPLLCEALEALTLGPVSVQERGEHVERAADVSAVGGHSQRGADGADGEVGPRQRRSAGIEKSAPSAVRQAPTRAASKRNAVSAGAGVAEAAAAQQDPGGIRALFDEAERHRRPSRSSTLNAAVAPRRSRFAGP